MRVPAIRVLPPQSSLIKALAHDLPLKAVAVGLALMMWAVAALAIPHESVRALDGRVPVDRPEVPEGYVLRGQLGDVSVRLRGPDAVVNAVGLDRVRATLDISSLELGKPEPQDAPVKVTVEEPNVAVAEVSPATVPVRLERLVSRSVVVQPRLANAPTAGFQPGEASVSPREVQVSGAASAVAAVTAVYATVRFGDAGVDLVQSAPALAVDASGNAVDGVEVAPASVSVSVPVLPTATTRTVAVLFDVRGTPAPGFYVSAVGSTPAAVTVRGSQDALAGLDRLQTAPVDVGGFNSTRTVRVPILLPDGVEMLQPVDATITVTIAPLTGTRSFPQVAIQPVGLAANLAADIEPRTVDVVIAGTLGALAGADVTAVVDVTGKGKGTFQADVVVRAPAGTEIRSVQPSRVTVTIKDR